MLLVLPLMALLVAQPGCGADQPEVKQPDEASSTTAEDEALDTETLWLRLVPPPDPTRGPGTAVIEVGLSGTRAKRDHLGGIRLPDKPSKHQVRLYVGSILRAAAYNGMYSGSDPEVELLKRVGVAHVGVLIEPLFYLPMLNGDIYLIEALNTLVTAEHKTLVLSHLASAPGLIEVVAAHKWTEDAGSILFAVLAERSPHLYTDWVEAAALLARPEHYEDLKFQLGHGSNPHSVWEAIRNLPGIEPLEPSIVGAWHSTSRASDPHEWGQLAMVAAHYGHVAGLEFIVEEMAGYWPAWQAFHSLTAYSSTVEGGLRPEVVQEARKWFEANKDRLVFDRDKGRYYLRDR